ncbi:hypothetical protein PTSG_02975 [Salpingoeca rosetta]|uniref:Phytanoyl-CoA dioxygenase n=1 Tax=Salpingoeca rosetta (strain ATCC 50818 / BSB-021) TaxID=946362 RepID=F2U3W3_SALR5|nr:uncharacterized protein PTSG_02975 [Salpingoeca rosetta]EGD82307.1 hypothetical protein PTSG_02975 [Salpingoeca rosetta]|eukprot:XP_004996490.1 hypothetical protein PTSG_02975 [Salpingoeca rosetta]
MSMMRFARMKQASAALLGAAGRCRGSPQAVLAAAGVRLFHCPVSEQVVGDIELTDEDINAYDRKGFIRVPQILSASQLEKWRTAVDEAVAERANSPVTHGAEEERADNVFLQRVNLWETHESLATILSNAKEVLGRMACQLEGISGVRVYHDRAMYEPAFADQLPWTVDMPHWSFTSPHALSIWIALDDITPESGCMYFLPGSHKIIEEVAQREGKYRDVGRGKYMRKIFDEVPELLESGKDAMAVDLKAGDCIFHNGRVVYASGPNMTSSPRRAMTIQLMPFGCTFNGRRSFLTEEEFKALKVGDSLDDDKSHPILYTVPEEQDTSSSA